MHKFARVAFAALLFGVSIPSPAHAASIGILGGDVDPDLPFITDIGFVNLLEDNPGDPAGDPCAFLPNGFFCAAYEVANDGDFPTVIDSIDFRMRKPTGELYSTAEIGEFFTVHEDSDLSTLVASTLFADEFTFTLFDFDSLVCPLPGGESSFCRADFFSDDPNVVAVSVVGVNGVANPGATLVPEPVALLLMGAGLTGVLTRRRLARR